MMNSRYEPDNLAHDVPSRLTSYSTDGGASWGVGTSATVGDLVSYAGDSCEGSTITAGAIVWLVSSRCSTVFPLILANQAPACISEY